MLVAVVVVACAGGDGRVATPTRTPTAPVASPTPQPAIDVDTTPPARDPIDLARRFRGVVDAPRTVALPPPTLGAAETFDVLILPSDPDQPPERRTVTARLRAVSEHAYHFVEEGLPVDDKALDAAVRALERAVWPRVTQAFGPPPIPGIDGDPRIAVLYADLGSAVGGYVSGEDAYPRSVVPFSNERELIYVNARLVSLDDVSYEALLAHEFQHLVHQAHDPDEEAWVNEGLSQVAAALVLPGASSAAPFLSMPDTQLNAWSITVDTGAHYGASELFFTYLLEQTGASPAQLVAEPADGVAGVRAFLRAVGEPRSFADLVADWAVANLLDASSGPYGYRERDVGPPVVSQRIDGPGRGQGQVQQFAAGYLEVDARDFSAPPTIAFDGADQVPVIAGQDGGDAFWWSNRGDGIDSRLTRELDLTGVERATLTFRTWFDIERWFDYGYVAVSTDGERWVALAGQHTDDRDPLGVALGPGYTGRSGGADGPRWVTERIDLTPYAGQRLLLRFEYVTDDSAHGPGWAVDDIAVPEIGFFDDGSGWQREGFVRVSEPLAQRFRLRLVTFGPEPAVRDVPLDARNRARIRLDGLGTEYNRAVLVIVAVTEGTLEPARYTYEATVP